MSPRLNIPILGLARANSSMPIIFHVLKWYHTEQFMAGDHFSKRRHAHFSIQ